jgi:glycerol-3-phosphate dehydrogenase
MAPHLVHPLVFLLPLYKEGRVGMFKMGLGMWLYDMLALFHAPKFHERLTPQKTLKKLESLRDGGLLGSYLYSDAYMDDDRLVIETLRSAHSFGAVAINYIKVEKAQFDEKNKICSLNVHDLKNSKKYSVKAKHFVSSVGPWTDIFGNQILSNWKKLLRPSKGIHLTVPAYRLPTKEAIVMATDSDKRIIFAIPRGEIVIVGTTDTDFPQSPDKVKSESEDVSYLLKIVNDYFPGARLTKEDVISSYAGVRPLVDDGSQTESKTSREHVIKSTEHNVTFVAGGKYTTYRRMARDIVEAVLKKEFSLEERIQFARNQTREALNPLVTKEKLTEAVAQVSSWSREFQMKEENVKFLCERHGYEAYELLQVAQKEKYSLWQVEAWHAIHKTMCFHLKDFMLRRVPLYLTQWDHGLAQLSTIAEVFKQQLNWDNQQLETELNSYMEHLKSELNWKNSEERK